MKIAHSTKQAKEFSAPQRYTTLVAKHVFELFTITLTAYAPQLDDVTDIDTTGGDVTHTYQVEYVDFSVNDEVGLRVKTIAIHRDDVDHYVITEDVAVRRALMRCQELAAHLFTTGLSVTYPQTPTQPNPTTGAAGVRTSADAPSASTTNPTVVQETV